MYGTIKLKPKVATGGLYSRKSPFVARITGFDDKYIFQREFLYPIRDYTYASKWGKGVIWYYFVPPGIYDVLDILSWKHEHRYYARVFQDASIVEISEAEVKAWLTKNGC